MPDKMDSTPENVSMPDPDTETKCLNCSSELAGQFCHICGQSASITRYRLRSIGKEIFEQFRKIDAMTTFRTFWALTKNPGDFVSAYLSGKRTGFLSPVKYFFYSFVVQVLVGSWLFWLTNDHTLDQMSHVEFRSEIVMFISTGFWGVLWRLFYRKADLNVVENIVAAIFFVGQVNFYTIILELITFPLQKAGIFPIYLPELLQLVIQLGYSFYFARGLFRDRYLLLIPKQLVLSCLYFVLVIVIFVGAFSIGSVSDQLNRSRLSVDNPQP